MENTNEMQVTFDSRSSNEAFARVTVAAKPQAAACAPCSWMKSRCFLVLYWRPGQMDMQ